MCWLWFHKWSKWVCTKTSNWKCDDAYQSKFEKHTFKATCERCGIVKFKYVDEL